MHNNIDAFTDYTDKQNTRTSGDNVASFDNYIGKVTIDGNEYYVRTTVQNQKGDSGTHSFFVTAVDVYKKTAEVDSSPGNPRATEVSGKQSADGLSEPKFPSDESDQSRIVDAKLQQFFERASEDLRKIEAAEAAEEISDGGIRFRMRESEPPKKTCIGYKVFVLKDGKLYPPMVANADRAETPTGVWLDADANEQFIIDGKEAVDEQYAHVV